MKFGGNAAIIFGQKMNKLPPGPVVTQAYLETECKNLVASVEAMKVRNCNLVFSDPLKGLSHHIFSMYFSLCMSVLGIDMVYINTATKTSQIKLG